MSLCIPIKYTLDDATTSLVPGDRQWSAPLPVSRRAFGLRPRKEDFHAALTYGDYFSAARHFLERNDYALLNSGLEQVSGGTCSAAQVDAMAICLVKHGAYYHPACIEAQTGGATLRFVLNVAVSREGCSVMAREIESLQRLHDELAEPYWPQVFGHGQGHTTSGRPLSMFLGRWMEGFFEFHLTAGPEPTGDDVVVWDTDHGHRLLSGGQIEGVLRQAAGILAYAYHPLTFEAVRNWHHAAGDFVVRPLADAVDLRLISVRDYGPFLQHPDPDMTAVLEALPVMLVATSLRLRLDRLDGTGSFAVYPDSVVPYIWDGFRFGLQRGFAQRGLPAEFFSAAMDFIALHDSGKLAGIASDLVDRHRGTSAERDLLRRMAPNHASRLAAAIAG